MVTGERVNTQQSLTERSLSDGGGGGGGVVAVC